MSSLGRPRPAAGGGRRLLIPPERLGRWLDGVADRHGTFTEVRDDEGAVRIACADGTTLTVRAPFAWAPEPALLSGFTAAASRPRRAGVLLVRRGRWATGVFDGRDLVVSKVDARLVQGRTAAGGWSQQRFARRRDGQVHGLVGTATEVAVRVLLPGLGDDALVTGGDRALIDRVLADPRLRPLPRLRRGLHLEFGDPKFDLVKELPERGRAIRIALDERPSPP